MESGSTRAKRFPRRPSRDRIFDFEIAETPLKPGLLAVSVSLYHMSYPMYDDGALRLVGPVEVQGLGEPIAKLGGSIHVYRVAP